MARILLITFGVIFLVHYSLEAPSKQQLSNAKADCETCNWKYNSAKLDRFRNEGAVLDRCVQPGTLALTFGLQNTDDGPYVSSTKAVLDVLKAENVTATFFVNGENYWPPLDDENARAVLRRTRDEGHYIASHTWSHHYLISQTTESMKYEMSQLSDKVLEILGERPSVMRPPYGKFNDTVIDIVYGQMGYKLILWVFVPVTGDTLEIQR